MTDHDHTHSHSGHVHAPRDFSRAFAVGTALNVAFVLVEIVFGVAANSMALLADAGHNLSDVIGLLIAWGAGTLVKRPPTERFTYGLRSSSILAALANAVLLMIAVGGIMWEALQRFWTPAPIAAGTVIIVAAIGIAINLGTALMFMSGRKEDINIRGAYLHMAADAAVSAGVVVAGFIMLATGWTWIDPLVSLIIAAIIVWGTWSLLRDSLSMALHAVPTNIDTAAVRRLLEGLDGVDRIHDLHIWPMSTTETALTCHLVMPTGHPGDAFLARAAAELARQFGIAHPTLQIETGDSGSSCALEPDHVV